MRIAIILLSLIACSYASAEEAKGFFGSWKLYHTEVEGKSVCYIVSYPIKESGNYKKRSKPYAMITERPGSGYEVSVSSGFPYKSKKKITTKVDSGREHSLFSKGEVAWMKDSKGDKALIAEMQKGKRLVIEGTSEKGTNAKDTYSLSGFGKAFKQLKNC